MDMNKQNYAIKIGKRLRREREHLGLNQTEFGELFGYTQKSISDFERGIVLLPTEAAIKVSTTLNLSLDYLLNGRAVDYQSKLKEDHNFSFLASLYEICPKPFQGLCVKLLQQVVSYCLYIHYPNFGKPDESDPTQ